MVAVNNNSLGSDVNIDTSFKFNLIFCLITIAGTSNTELSRIADACHANSFLSMSRRGQSSTGEHGAGCDLSRITLNR